MAYLQDGQIVYEYDAGGAVLDLAWNATRLAAKAEADDGARAVQRVAVAQADKRLGVVDLTAYLT